MSKNKYIYLILFLAVSLLSKAGVNKSYLSLELRQLCQEPDTNIVIYPIPNGESTPNDDIYNQSPLYLNNPSNVTREVIYDPVTGLYTFYDKVGDILIICRN